MKKTITRKSDEYDNGIFQVANIDSKVPKSIYKKLYELKRKSKGKIPVLIIRDRDLKIKIEVKLCGTKVERQIFKLNSDNIITLALEHLQNCRKGRRY